MSLITETYLEGLDAYKDLEPLCCGSLVNQKKSLVRQPLGAVKLTGNVIDPPTWCGAATTTLCGGRGDPHLLWRSSLVKFVIKLTVIEFMGETWLPRNDTLSECFNNVDVGVPLWLTEQRDKHPRQEFASSYPAL